MRTAATSTRTALPALPSLILLTGAGLSVRAQERALSYTPQQSGAGPVAYLASCEPLEGPEFMRRFGARSDRELYEVPRITMPSANPGSLAAATYAALVAGHEPLRSPPDRGAAVWVFTLP